MKSLDQQRYLNLFCLQSLVDVGEGTQQGYDSMSPVVASTTAEGEDEEHHDETKPRERSPIETIFVYIMKQSYAASLIIMMVGLNTTMLNIEKPGWYDSVLSYSCNYFQYLRFVNLMRTSRVKI